MTLIEALKTGKRIRRPPEPFSEYDFVKDGELELFTMGDVLSEQWEVEPEMPGATNYMRREPKPCEHPKWGEVIFSIKAEPTIEYCLSCKLLRVRPAER